MSIKNRIKDNKNIIYYGIFVLTCTVAGIIILGMPWGSGPVIFDDSPAYMAKQLPIGVVPGYPLFLSINRLIFGETAYLNYVVAEQIIINILVSHWLVLFLKKRLDLNFLESFMFYVLSFVPHTVFMPDGMSTTMIVTEALAFPVFYILVMCLLKTVWDKKVEWGLLALLTAAMLGVIRTQLQLTIVLPALAVLYVLLIKAKWFGRYKLPVIVRFLVGGLCALIFVVVGLYGTRVLNRQFQKVMVSVVNSDTVENEQITSAQENSNDPNYNMSSQMVGVLYAKVMFVAEAEDTQLFENMQMAEFYNKLYEELLEGNRLLNSVEIDIYIADYIFNRIDGVFSESFKILSEYDIALLEKYNYAGGVITEVLMTLLQNHPLRWIKSGLLQMPSGLISSVFFHKRDVYWLSHIITAIIYLYAIISGAWGIKKKTNLKAPEFMYSALFINLAFVGASAVVYIALQRYVVYGFGIFYMAAYFMLKQIIGEYFKKEK